MVSRSETKRLWLSDYYKRFQKLGVLKGMLLKLNDYVEVYPGHDYGKTLHRVFGKT